MASGFAINTVLWQRPFVKVDLRFFAKYAAMLPLLIYPDPLLGSQVFKIWEPGFILPGAEVCVVSLIKPQLNMEWRYLRRCEIVLLLHMRYNLVECFLLGNEEIEDFAFVFGPIQDCLPILGHITDLTVGYVYRQKQECNGYLNFSSAGNQAVNVSK